MDCDEQVCLSPAVRPRLSWCISMRKRAGQAETAGQNMDIEENWFTELVARSDFFNVQQNLALWMNRYHCRRSDN